jgi:hypothetical protein
MCPNYKQFDEERVGEEEPGLGEAHAVGDVDQQRLRAPRLDPLPRGRVAVEPRLEPRRGTAVGRPETEQESLGQTLSRRELLG